MRLLAGETLQMKDSNSTISKLRVLLAGATVLVTAFVVGISPNAYQKQLISELPNHADSFESVQISDGRLPMADQEVETTKSTSYRTVKLSRASKKTYTKRLPDKVVSKSTVREDEEDLVVRDTTTKTEKKEKYTKKKKSKRVITTVIKTKITTTYPVEGSANEDVQTSTGTSSKYVKLKAKAKKTYTKKLPKSVSTKTTVKTQGDNLIQTDKVVETTKTERYTKNKKTKKVTSKVKTTIITSTFEVKHTEPVSQEPAASEEPATTTVVEEPATTTVSEEPVTGESEEPTQPEVSEEPTATETTEPAAQQPPEQTEETTTQPEEPTQPEVPSEPATTTAPEDDPSDVPSNDTAPALPEGKSAIRTAAPQADECVLYAFEELGFTFSVNANYSYTGCFDSRTRTIKLKRNDDNVYHELGHFLAFAAGNYDLSSAFGEIYKSEKKLYNGRNSAYVLSSASEYFAESYRDYVLYKSTLKKERPKTYDAVELALSRINDTQIARLKRVYGQIWTK